MTKKISFKVTADGKVLFDYNGFQGETCLTEFSELLKALKEEGIEIEARETQRKVVGNAREKILH